MNHNGSANSGKTATNHRGFVHLDARAGIAKMFIMMNFLFALGYAISWYWYPFPANPLSHARIENALYEGLKWSLVIAAVMFFRWYFGAVSNARTLNPSTMNSGAIGAVVWWFIPIANLFQPVLLMKSIWRGSLAEPENFPKRSGYLVLAWWLTWLFGMGVLGLSAGIHSANMFYSLTEKISPGSCYALVSLFASAIMICRIITQITHEQNRTFAVRLAEAKEAKVETTCVEIAPAEEPADNGDILDITSNASIQN